MPTSLINDVQVIVAAKVNVLSMLQLYEALVGPTPGQRQ